MGKTGKLKATPVLETGITLEFKPGQAPVPKTCHLMLRWAVEKCPACSSALMMYYAPTVKHESGVEPELGEEHKLVVSCVNCNFMVSSHELWNLHGQMLKQTDKNGAFTLGYPE